MRDLEDATTVEDVKEMYEDSVRHWSIMARLDLEENPAPSPGDNPQELHAKACYRKLRYLQGGVELQLAIPADLSVIKKDQPPFESM